MPCTQLLLVGAGLALLFGGGETLVRGAVALAARLGLPPALIGLTVVGFGTSMPELVVSLDAALGGTNDIAVGNVLGSNIANILLILGLSALVWPIATAGLSLRRDLMAMLGATLVLIPLFLLGSVGRIAGAALVAGLAVYLWSAFRDPSQGDGGDAGTDAAARTPFLHALGFVAAGLLALVFGARFLVDGAVTIARDLGVSEAFIGLTIVAVGTSLPELATSVVAALRRQSGIAVGNVVGSNIFNVLGILGLTATLSPLVLSPRFLIIDLPVVIAASLALIVLLRQPRIGRLVGAALLAAYAGYVVFGLG
ncbi:MAG: calcium/sodium antiporter [Pararhodobacter sp.]